MDKIMSALKWLWQPAQDLQDSAKIKDGGYSARKVNAYCTLVLYLYANYKVFSNPELQHLYISLFIIDALFIAFMLGLVTFAEIIKFKNGGNADGEQDNKPAIPPVINADEKPNLPIQSDPNSESHV